MIELKLRHTALRVDFSFVAVLAVFFWLDRSGFGFVTLGLCAAHELAHLVVMLAYGIIPESITFYGAGIRISAPEVDVRSVPVRTAVYSAGCIMNFLLAGLFLCRGYGTASAVSLLTGCFNLLPVGEFDGFRLLSMAVISGARPEHVDSILFWSGLASAVLMSGVLIFFGREVSPTLVITSAYIILMALRRV